MRLIDAAATQAAQPLAGLIPALRAMFACGAQLKPDRRLVGPG